MVSVKHIVNKVYASRTYIISQEGSQLVWLVDCGDVPPIVDMLSSLGGSLFEIKGVLLTHAHYDHMYGLPKLTEQFPSLMVYTNEIGKKALASERLNFSKYHEDPINFVTDNVVVCGDGDEIELYKGVKAVVHYTPGHDPSCLTYEVRDYLFTGDSFIPGIKVVTNLPGGDKVLASESVESILRLAEGKILCPGHVIEEEN